MIDQRFCGLGVAIVTPFKNDGSVDYESLETLINFQIQEGLDFLVTLGTTGETPTLADKERYAIMDFTQKVVNKRVPIVAGYGGNDTAHILRAMSEYPLDGIDAVLSVAPYYNKPNQKSLIAHYSAIAEKSNKPIILYNVPGRTGVNIEAETVLSLSDKYENIIGIKEASGNIPQCMDILSKRNDNFLFLSGDDNITYALMCMGANGVISVIGNAYPKEMNDMIYAVSHRKWNKAKKIHFRLLNMMKLIFKEGNPAGIKSVLKLKGLCENVLRLPLTEASPELFSEIENEYNLIASNIEELVETH